MLVLNADLRVRRANRSFYRTFKVTPEETVDRLVYDLGNQQWDIPWLRKLLEEVLPQDSAFDDFEVEHVFPAIGRKFMLLNARRFPPDSKHPELILLAIEDITERKQAEVAVQTSEVRYRRLFQTAKDGILILDADTGKVRYSVKKPLTDARKERQRRFLLEEGNESLAATYFGDTTTEGDEPFAMLHRF
jgi:PAS domain-containing protein